MTGADFEPIAIVGQGCVLPGCFTPSGLWRAVRDGRSLLSPPADDVWGLHPNDHARQGFIAGGFVRGFDKRFVPDAHDLEGLDPRSLDPFVQWLLQAGSDAWRDAGGFDRLTGRTAVFVANLAYPSRGLTDYASDIWMDGHSARPPIHRFNAGFPAMALARSVKAEGTRYCLDAACASSLYALWLGCRELQSRRADHVLCGAVNGVDNLFLHQGFRALNAISPTGRSRPLVQGADGLVPSEGAAALVLRRLVDVAPSDPVYAVIRGIGLSNDGRRKGLLAPDGDGQAEAIRRAYAAAGLDPTSDVALLECHATGTPVGDGVELAASNAVFGEGRNGSLAVGSVKSNTGHLITVAGLASVLKIVSAFQHGRLPPTRMDGAPLDAFDGLSLHPQTELRPWPDSAPRRAGISTFGFGGNNAHLILEAFDEGAERTVHAVKTPDDPIVICGIGAIAGPDRGIRAIVRRLMRAREHGCNKAEHVHVDPKAARTPPSDLQRAESQQLAVLDVSTEALDGVTRAQADRTGCIVAMNCAPDAARWMLRERLAARFGWPADEEDTQAQKDAIAPEGNAADVLGAMPNMPANRLNVREDWRGMGFTVACEQTSGSAALHAAIAALETGQLDMVLVAGADFATDPVHTAAFSALTGSEASMGDAAAALILKRQSQAISDGDTVLATLNAQAPDAKTVAPAAMPEQVVQMYGNSHAAGELLSLAITSALGSRGCRLAGEGVAPRIQAATAADHLGAPAPDLIRGGAHLFWCAAETRSDLLDALRAGKTGGTGHYRLALVGRDKDQLDALKQVSLEAIEASRTPDAEGAYWNDGHLSEGETAFVFTGSASAYPQAGRGLFMAFPELGPMLAARAPHIDILSPLLSKPSLTPFQDLCCGVLNSQAQAILLREWFGLQPDAAIGLSLGETNALIAFGAWRDAEALLDAIAEGAMYERHLGGDFDVLRSVWGESIEPRWQNWQISAPIERVRALVDAEPHADITIIYSPEDCLIGGHPDACARIASAIEPGKAIPTGHDFVIHTQFMRPYAEAWRNYHSRETYPAQGLRFYSNGHKGAYAPDKTKTANALTRQACNTIDFPATLEQAYADGVRVFIEIGPRDLLTRSIQRTLAGREHLAVAIDRTDRSDVLQLTHAVAQLYVAGHDIDLEALSRRLDEIEANPWRSPMDSNTTLTLPAHKPCPVRPMSVGRAPPVETPHNGARMSKAPPQTDLEHIPDAPPQPKLESIERPSGLSAPDKDERPAPNASPKISVARPDPVSPPTDLRSHNKPRPSVLPPKTPSGPSFDRDALEAAARGPISDLFGPLFQAQDKYRRQVRLPAPPLLLVDRITGIDAAPAQEGRGTIWTETDIAEDAWNLHERAMRPGPLIEAGQADLSLISYMGADLKNRDERVYRLLGCEFTFQNGPLPKPGDTLSYQIEITGHAMTGDVRLFFFQYDCHIGDRLLLSVRNGQAGFFTDAELTRSKGVLWSPDTASPPTLSPAPCPDGPISGKTSFSTEDLDALRNGDPLACFGPGFESAAPQTRPARLPGQRLALIDEIPKFDPDGGPWGRGYLVARQSVPASAWFFNGHFHNDPCMPGTLMVEAALQALEFYAMACGLTVDRDGFVFEPADGMPAKFTCRGQITPDKDREIQYEVFIDEIIDGDEPIISAALLASCDGLKVFHCDRISLVLKRAWPLLTRDAPVKAIGPDRQARGDQNSLIACATGAPSDAFGAMYQRFDHESRVPRLPQPPFHFMTSVDSVSTPAGTAERGAEAVAVYRIPDAAWYFAEGGTGDVPFAVLSEILLQPCGWLASHCGFALSGGAYFRNLDGDLTVHRPVSQNDRLARTRIRLDAFSKAGPVTIVRFTVKAEGERGDPIATLDTSFGFFNKEAFAKQAGIKASPILASALQAPSRPTDHLLNARPSPSGRLAMVDQIDMHDPKGGSNGLGIIRGQQAVDPYAWYFKAHFFQDPVQPGSLGIGALLNLLTEASLTTLDDDERGRVRIEAPAVETQLQWRCRGQVTPNAKQVTTVIDVTNASDAGNARLFNGNGILACDGVALYDAKGLAIRHYFV